MEKPRIRAASHSCLWSRAAVPVQQQRGPPFSRRATAPQEPKRFPYPYKKTARSISTGSGRFLLFSVRQRTAAEVLPSSPHFSPQHSGRLNRRRNSCRTASPPVESLGRGRMGVLQKGSPSLPQFPFPTSTHPKARGTASPRRDREARKQDAPCGHGCRAGQATRRGCRLDSGTRPRPQEAS